MGRQLDILAAQVEPHLAGASFAAFAEEARRLVAGAPGLDLLVFPELHLFHAEAETLEARNAALQAAAQPLDGPLDQALGALARELGVCLLPGSICERGEKGELFNTAPVYDASGRRIAFYRKVFPWRPTEPFDPGDRFVVFDLPHKGRIGLSICYDAWFPEATRQLAWQGAELVLNIVKTTTPDREQELVLARANAIVNQLFMLSLNCAGPVGRGQSLLVGPEGEGIAECDGAGPGLIRARIDLARAQATRQAGTCGENRMWLHFRPGEPRILLPAYHGYIDPEDWKPPGLDPEDTPA